MIVGYHLCLLTVVFIVNLWRAVDMRLHLPDGSKLSIALMAGLLYCAMFAEIIILGIYCVRRAVIKKLANRLVHFDVASRKIDLYQSNASLYRGYIFYFGYLFIVTNYVVWDGIARGIRVSSLIRILSYLVISWFIVQYALILNIIRSRFEVLNCSLNSNFIKLIGKSMILVQNKLIVRGPDENIFIRIMRAHGTLLEITREVSEFYSFPVFLAIAVMTYGIIVSSYWTLLPYLGGSWPLSMVHSTTGSLFWVCTVFTPIIILTCSVTGITTEVFCVTNELMS